jgi:hypothetical protein
MITPYILTLGFIVLCLIFFLLVRIVETYINSRANRFNPEKNYIVYIAIGAIMMAFTSLYPTPLILIINAISKKVLGSEIEGFSTEPNSTDIIMFLIFVLAICVLVFIAKKSNITPFNLKKLLFSESPSAHKKESPEKQINYPDPIPTDSPHLHIRVKELFELQYKKDKLHLKRKIKALDSNGDILYGYTEDPFDITIKLIYCESIGSKDISIARQTQVYNILKKIDTAKFTPEASNKDRKIHYYYITPKGDIIPNNNLKSFQVWTEDEFLNSLINFEPYLKNTLISQYENNKLFSATNKEEDRKTLKETFISPNWILESQDQTPQKELLDYIDHWITESIPKHLVLLGDYGMGKTSFFKHYAAHLAQEALSNKTIHRFPVLISLTNTSPIHGGLDKLIESFVATHLGVDYALFEKLVQKGKILFLLDSFDEMGYIGTHERQFEQFNQIWQLATTNNKILISGRPSYFPNQVQLKQNLNIPRKGAEAIQTKPYTEVIKLENLTQTDISKYLSIYYLKDASKYYDWLVQNKSLLSLCRRPSMMHIIREMMPQLYQKENDFSANEVMSLYIDYWIDRQETKEISSAFLHHEDKKQPFLKEFYTELSASFYLADQSKEKSEIIINKLHIFLDTRQEYQFLKNPKNIEGLEREILSAYFLEIDPDDTYKFVHKSFFEFFVAAKIIDLVRANNFKHPLINTTWSSEIIDFTYDVIEEKKQEKKTKFKKPIPSLLIATGSNPFIIRLKIALFKISNSCFHHDEDHILNMGVLVLIAFFINIALWIKCSHNFFWSLNYSLNSLFCLFLVIILIVRKNFKELIPIIIFGGFIIFNFLSLFYVTTESNYFIYTILRYTIYVSSVSLMTAIITGSFFGLQLIIGGFFLKMHFFQFIAKAYYIHLLKEEISEENCSHLFNTLHKIYNYSYFKKIKIKSLDSFSYGTLEQVSIDNIINGTHQVTFQNVNVGKITNGSLYRSIFTKTKFTDEIKQLDIQESSFDQVSQTSLVAQIKASQLQLGESLTLDVNSMLPLIRTLMDQEANQLNDLEIGKKYLELQGDKLDLAVYFYKHHINKDKAREYINTLSIERQKKYIFEVLHILYWNNDIDKAHELIMSRGIKAAYIIIDLEAYSGFFILLLIKKQFSLINELALHTNGKDASYFKNKILPLYEQGITSSENKKIDKVLQRIKQAEIDYA